MKLVLPLRVSKEYEILWDESQAWSQSHTEVTLSYERQRIVMSFLSWRKERL